MKIDVHVLCKNEVKLAPFFIDYWKALADEVEVYVYDGCSTDGTRELFAKYDWIHIIDWESDGVLDDYNHRDLKNECWKQSRGKADLVMVCDFDETIFAADGADLREELEKMVASGGTILLPLSFSLIPDKFPKYEKGKWLHELCEYGFNDCVWETKPIIFDPNKIDEYNCCCGGHWALPKGDVVWYHTKNLFLIHAKYVGFDYYRERIHNRVVAERCANAGMDGETRKTEEEFIQTFESCRALRFKWADILANFDEYYKNRIDWSMWGIRVNISLDK